MKPAPSYSWPADSGMAGRQDPPTQPRNSFTSRVRKNSTPAFNNAQPKQHVALKITMPEKGQHLPGGMLHKQKLKVVLRHQALQYGDQL